MKTKTNENLNDKHSIRSMSYEDKVDWYCLRILKGIHDPTISDNDHRAQCAARARIKKFKKEGQDS